MGPTYLSRNGLYRLTDIVYADSIAKQKRAREEDAKRHRRQLEHEEQMKKDAEESVRLYKSRMEEREKDYRKAFKKAGSGSRCECPSRTPKEVVLTIF